MTEQCFRGTIGAERTVAFRPESGAGTRKQMKKWLLMLGCVGIAALLLLLVEGQDDGVEPLGKD